MLVLRISSFPIFCIFYILCNELRIDQANKAQKASRSRSFCSQKKKAVVAKSMQDRK